MKHEDLEVHNIPLFKIHYILENYPVEKPLGYPKFTQKHRGLMAKHLTKEI